MGFWQSLTYRVPGMEEEWRALLKQAWKRLTHHGAQALEVITALYARGAMAQKASGNAMGGLKRAPQNEATAAEGAEVKQTSLRYCPGWSCGAPWVGARDQLVSDTLNQSVELAI